MTAFADIDMIERACRTLRLDAPLARALVNSARPTVWLDHAEPVPDGDLAKGACKIGGEPDMPPSLAWPVRPPVSDPERAARSIAAAGWAKDASAFAAFATGLLDRAVPMAFLAQIDLGAMAREPGFDPALPDRGMLWAFNDPFAELYPTQSPHGGIALLWSDAGGLARRETPPLLREAWERGVSDLGTPQPEPWDADVAAEPLSPVSGWTVSPRLDRQAYLRLRDQRFEMAVSGDQLGGWEEPIQRVMHGGVEMIATGRGDPDADQAETMLRAGERWRHVLTVNAETYLPRLMPTWLDGAMYIFVDERDLAARHVDHAVGNGQWT